MQRGLESDPALNPEVGLKEIRRAGLSVYGCLFLYIYIHFPFSLSIHVCPSALFDVMRPSCICILLSKQVCLHSHTRPAHHAPETFPLECSMSNSHSCCHSKLSLKAVWEVTLEGVILRHYSTACGCMIQTGQNGQEPCSFSCPLQHHNETENLEL